MKKYNAIVFWVLLALIMVWGLALRSVELVNGNFLFGLDHGRDYLAAYNIVENRKITLIGAEAGSGAAGINGIFHGPGYFYLISIAYMLFHGNPIGAEIFMTIFGMSALAVAAWVGYKISGKTASLLFAFFVSISPLIVSQSRFIWSSHPITVFVILAIFFVYKIADNPKIYAPLALFMSGFTYNSQLGVAVPLTISVLFAIIFIYKIRDWKVYGYCFIALAVAYFPMILFEIRHGFMAARSAISYVMTGGSGGSIFDPMRISKHKFDYWNNFYNTFTFEFGWIPWATQMIFLKVMMPVAALGLFFVKEKKSIKFIYFLLLMIITTWIGFLFLNNTVWDYYLTHLRIGYILLFVYAIIALLRIHKKSVITNVGIIISAIFIFVLVVGSIFRQYITYTLDLRDSGVIDKIQGKKTVIDMLYNDAKGEPFSVFIFVPPIYTFPYDYLFMTYGKQKYGYVPLAEKKGLAYLIIEPDNGQPWRQKGWLETVVQGGETIWKKTVLNGILIEKRIYSYEKSD